MFHRLVGMIDRIWTVTRTVISLVPSIVPDGDASCPDHEIARAYEVLGGGEDGEEEEGTMDHTSLLSGCWRATKEAGCVCLVSLPYDHADRPAGNSGLLSILLALPINQAKEKQVMWTDREIDAGGRRFLTWLHEIRHRGTFSKVAMALSRLVDAVKTVDSLRHLCVSWLQVSTLSSRCLCNFERLRSVSESTRHHFHRVYLHYSPICGITVFCPCHSGQRSDPT